MEPKLAPDLFLGTDATDGAIIRLSWRENNGILIAGQSGSGKSHSAEWYLTQYAYQGVQLVVCDYDSPLEDEEALSERVNHLSGAFFLPPAKTAEEINERLRAISAEYELRKQDPTRRFPLLLVIDEVSAYLSYLKEIGSTSAIESFARELLQVRKVNIRAMIIGQEWSSGFATTSMRYIRSAFRVKLVHRLDGPNSKMVLDMADTNTMRLVGQLKTGQMYWDGLLIDVPANDFSENVRNKVINKIAQFNHGLALPDALEMEKYENDLSSEEQEAFLNELFLRYGKSAGYNLDFTDPAEIVRFWLSKGYSKYAIVNYLVKGSASKVGKLYDQEMEKWQIEQREKGKIT